MSTQVALLAGALLMASCALPPSPPQQTLDAIQALNLEVHNLLDYGMGPSEWDGTERALVEWGSGDCGYFVTLLSRRLLGLDIPHKIVGTVGDGVIHSVVVFRMGDSNYVADPTVGILYKNSFEELFREPSLARSYKGIIDVELSAYAGEGFFSQINWLTSSPVIGGGAYPVWSKNFKSGGQINLEFQSSLSPSWAAVRSPLSGQVRIDGVDFRVGENEIRYYAVSSEWNRELTFSSEAIARRAEIGLLAERASSLAPQRVFLGFEGGKAQIDSVRFLNEGEVFIAIDFGVLESERGGGSYVYADNLGTWGQVIEGKKRNFREHNSSIEAKFTHSVLTVRPPASVLKFSSESAIEVCYRDLDEIFGEVYLKFEDLSAGDYQMIATLSPRTERGCSSYLLATSLLQNAWLER